MGVASAKNVIDDVCIKINSAEAIAYNPPQQPIQLKSNYIIFLCLAFIALSCITVTHINNKKKRKISASVFKPTSLIQSII